jgi:hypothetical protein
LNSEKPLEPQDSESQIPAFQSLENQGPQEPEIEISGKDRTLTFERVNEVTWKLTDGRGSFPGVATGAAATAPRERLHGC